MAKTVPFENLKDIDAFSKDEISQVVVPVLFSLS
jgi:hypothetical protein